MFVHPRDNSRDEADLQNPDIQVTRLAQRLERILPELACLNVATACLLTEVRMILRLSDNMPTWLTTSFRQCRKDSCAIIEG